MQVLLVYAHPDPESFCGRLRDTAVAALEGAGHQVDLLDLYAEGFDPVLGPDEWSKHQVGIAALPELADHARRLGQARALVLVHPTWWGGQPAILKGWLDRVWIEGVAYTLPTGRSRVRPRLHNLRRIVVVTTHGSPHRMNRLQGEPGRLVAMRGVRALAHPLARKRFIAYYGIDRDEPERREAFVGRVARELARL